MPRRKKVESSPAFWLLRNWGVYLRYGNRTSLGYPSKAAFWVGPSKDGMPHWVNQNKADAVERVMMDFRPDHPVEAFALKLYFVENITDRAERAYHTQRRFPGLRCGARKADYVLDEAITLITPKILSA